MLTCNDANVLIVRTIDDALDGAERAALRHHLTSCARCRAEYETQHEVRRLLVLHIQDPLPDGFDVRLNARLARTSRPLGRTWSKRLLPLAATLALIAAEPVVRDAPLPASNALALRAFTTVVLPPPERMPRRQRLSPVAAVPAKDVALAPPQPAVAESPERGGETVVESVASEPVSAPEPLLPERERVTGRQVEAARDARDVRGEDERVGVEPAASHGPGILPRPPVPAAPIPFTRP